MKDSDLTKDIVQDVFLKVFSKSETLKDEQKLVSWIYQITRNEIISHFRKANHSHMSIEAEDPEIAEETFTAELAECIKPMLESLPEKYKEALVLSDLEKVTQKEIAERLNISYSGAKSRVQRAREMLRHAYEGCCDISADVYGDVLEFKPKNCGPSGKDSCN